MLTVANPPPEATNSRSAAAGGPVMGAPPLQDTEIQKETEEKVKTLKISHLNPPGCCFQNGK